MTIEQPVILNVGPEEFSIGLTYTGSSRTRKFSSLAFDPMPSFNRVLKIFSRPSFKEKEKEVRRRDLDITRREAEAGATVVGTEDVQGQGGEVEEMVVEGQEALGVELQGEGFSSETMDLEDDVVSSQLSQLSV